LCRDNRVITDAPSDAARRVAKGSSYDGTWSVAIYTLRGDCGSLRAALRIVGGRVYSADGSYQAYGGVGAGGAIRVTLVRGSQSPRVQAACRAVNPYSGWGAYGASKAALRHLTAIWAEEAKADGIAFLSLDPGDMDTPLHTLAVPDADPTTLK